MDCGDTEIGREMRDIGFVEWLEQHYAISFTAHEFKASFFHPLNM